ncbi:hypothetical protein VD0002_g6407 [Verticillium dahliae]|nr:hypothetical protein VD0002_g6407 [Verticillium dahliae]
MGQAKTLNITAHLLLTVPDVPLADSGLAVKIASIPTAPANPPSHPWGATPSLSGFTHWWENSSTDPVDVDGLESLPLARQAPAVLFPSIGTLSWRCPAYDLTCFFSFDVI